MLTQDIRLAFRTLRHRPSFTVAAVMTLALGMGATIAMFTVVENVLLRALPFPDSERVVVLCETNPRRMDWCGASPANVADWSKSSRQLESAGVARSESFIGMDASGSFGVRGGIATPGFLRVLRVRPSLGRLFTDGDMVANANHVAIVSDAFWRQRLGGDPQQVGRTVTLDGAAFTVIGVLPPDTFVPEYGAVDVWKPLSASVDDTTDRNWRGFLALGRLAPTATRSALDAELRGLRDELAIAYPASNADWNVRTEGLRPHLTGSVDRTLWLFLGAVSFVLLIACANVASLVLAQAAERMPEFAVRAALGASRARLVRQALLEHLVLSVMGGLAGLLVASWLTRVFIDLAPSGIPRLNEVRLDVRVALFAFALSVLTALVFGSVPAWRSSRVDRLARAQGGRRTTARETVGRSALVVIELALALVLLVGAGLLTRAFVVATRWDPGFDRSLVAVSFVLAPPAEYKSTAAAVQMLERVRDEVATVPGVSAVGLGSAGPLFGGGPETGTLAVEGGTGTADGPPVHWFDVDEHYFEALGMRLASGRAFSRTDRGGAPAVAVVNETLSRRYFPDGRAIGRRVTVMDHSSEIVGVVADVKPLRPDEATPAEIYWPIQQYPRFAAFLVVRAAPDISGLEASLRARAAGVQSSAQVSAPVRLDAIFDRTLVSPRFNLALIGAFAIIAVGLAAIGVAGLMAFLVMSRTREIGVRLALGAPPQRIVRQFLMRGLVLGAGGLVLGAAGAFWLARSLRALLYGVPTQDPLTFITTLAVLMVVALISSYVPARRAARVDPVVTLRAE